MNIRLTVKSPGLFAGILAVACCCLTSLGADREEGDRLTRRLSELEGRWEVSEEVNRLLGYANREDASCEHPISCEILVSNTMGDGMPAEKLTAFRRPIEDQGHRVVATGRFSAKYEGGGVIGPDCFISHADGATFVWCEAPFVGLIVGQTSFVRGAQRDGDLLILDFNPVHGFSGKRSVTPDTVAYRRIKK
jgi:hypothetical protein